MIRLNHVKTFGKNWALAWAGLLKWAGKWGGVMAAGAVGMVALCVFLTFPVFAWLWYRYGDLNPPGVESAPAEVYVVLGLWIVFWLVVLAAAAKTHQEISENQQRASE